MAISLSASSPQVSLSNPYSLLPLSEADYLSESSSQHCYGEKVQQQPGPSRKRKRSEFAVAVNGHGISIIDVQAPRVISTYSAPPTTRFTCSPISIKNSSGSIRWTYASISSKSRSLAVWKEQLVKRSSRTSSIASSPASEFSPLDTTIEHNSHPLEGDSNVLSLHNLEHGANITGETVPDDILVVREDGSLQCLSADLQVERWTVNNRNTPSHRSKGSLLISSTMSVTAAKKTVLKNRLEVLTGYQPKPGDCVLVALNSTARKGQNVEATFYLISNSSVLGHVRKLGNVCLAISGQSSRSQFTFHASTGTLFRKFEQLITTFDLSKLAPEPESLLNIASLITSVLPASSSNIFVSVGATISLYNTKYGATHATVNTTIKSDSIMGSDSGTQNSMAFLGYISEIDVAVAFNNQGIYAIQLNKSGVFTGDTILDSLCKGVKDFELAEDFESAKISYSLEDKNKPKKVKSENERRAKSVLKTLAELATDGDAFGFEKDFAEFVGLDRKTGAYGIQNGEANGVSVNGAESATHNSSDRMESTSPRLNGSSPGNAKDEDLPEFLYPLPEPGWHREPALQQLSQPFVASVLGMVFKPVFAESGALELELTMPVPNVFKFLLWEGYFSCTNLPAQGSGFVEALAKFDPELNLLLFFLENASNTAIPLKEVVTSVKVVMTDLVRSADSGVTGSTNEIGDEMDLNEESLDDEQLQRITQQVEKALEQAQSLLDLNDVKERILRAALLRVGRFAKSAIIKTLRETLNGAELAGLIRILRRELLRDSDEREVISIIGSRNHTDEVENVQDDEWLSLICDLLTNAVDAAGMTGLLLAKDTLIPSTIDTSRPEQLSDEAEEFEREELLLESLSSEVSATCEALEGASRVSEALAHFLLRAEAFGQMTYTPKRAVSDKENRPRRAKKSEIIAREKKKKAVLPMGYPPPVEKKNGANPTAQRKRNVRSQQYRKNLGVGAYALERIEV